MHIARQLAFISGLCHSFVRARYLAHQEKIYFVTWASEAKDALNAFCQLRRQSFGQLASRDTQETQEISGRHLGDTEKTQVCAGYPGCPKDTRLGLASRDTSKAS